MGAVLGYGAVMTPCYICGKGMEEVRLDARDLKPRPCTTCEDIIQETAFGRGDASEEMTLGDYVVSIFDEVHTTDGETDLGDSERR